MTIMTGAMMNGMMKIWSSFIKPGQAEIQRRRHWLAVPPCHVSDRAKHAIGSFPGRRLILPGTFLFCRNRIVDDHRLMSPDVFEESRQKRLGCAESQWLQQIPDSSM